jgi:phage repressor protein C with HTH and peptisase S24 domain
MDRYEKRRLLLKAAIDNLGRGGITKLAKACDIDPSYLSRLLYPEGKEGKKRIGEDIKEKIERGLGKHDGWLDSVENYSIPEHENTSVAREPTPTYKTSFSIKKYDEVGASMGKGIYLQDQPGQITNIEVTDEWLEKNVPHNTGKKNLGVVTGFGDSMLGMYNPGDPILVDSGVRTCTHDGVYFFRVGEEGFIKRLQRIPGEGIRVISKNTDYESWTITENMDFEVLGKVLIVWESAKF